MRRGPPNEYVTCMSTHCFGRMPSTPAGGEQRATLAHGGTTPSAEGNGAAPGREPVVEAAFEQHHEPARCGNLLLIRPILRHPDRGLRQDPLGLLGILFPD